MAFDVCVVGSLNVDLVAFVDRAPAAGETRAGTDFRVIPGGKGANQAAAAASLGSRTAIVGRVGTDAFAPVALAALDERGVDTTGVLADPGAPTGTASIVVDARGQNRIVVVPGANGRLDPSDLDRVPESRLLLLQFEIPMDTVLEAARRAKRRGVQIVLNAAPACSPPEALFPLLDVLVVNEVEASLLAGRPVDAATAVEAAFRLAERGVPRVVVTLGDEGAVAVDHGTPLRRPAVRVPVVDTTAAGDAFIGGLASGLTEGHSFSRALELGVAAGTLAVTRPGAQTSIPSREEVDRFLADAGA